MKRAGREKSTDVLIMDF